MPPKIAHHPSFIPNKNSNQKYPIVFFSLRLTSSFSIQLLSGKEMRGRNNIFLSWEQREILFSSRWKKKPSKFPDGPKIVSSHKIHRKTKGAKIFALLLLLGKEIGPKRPHFPRQPKNALFR